MVARSTLKHRGARLSRRTFLRASLALPLGAAALQPSAVHAKKRPSNILLVTTDDLGPFLGCYGDVHANTPHLDQLAREGVRFDRAYVTQASCSPSRSSIFTGLYPHQNGQVGLSHYGYTMPEGLPTLPALLKGAGYRTGVIGKVHVAPKEDVPFDWEGGINPGDTRQVAKVAERAGDFFEEAEGEPFFLMVNYLDPHRPLVKQVDGIPEEPHIAKEVEPFPFLGLDTPKVREEVAAYYDCVDRIDVGMGLLLDQLAAHGHAEDALIIFLGDHGPPFTRAKTTCYEAGLRAAFLVRWPGHAKAGTATDALVSTVDILPTCLEAAGLRPPRDLPGRSLAPLLKGRKARWRKTLCAEFNAHGPAHYYPRRSICTQQHKLILNLLPEQPNPIRGVDGCAAWAASRDERLKGSAVQRAYDTYAQPPAVEFYDLEKDPFEFHNEAENPGYEKPRKRLLRALEAWRKATGDPLLEPEALSRAVKRHADMAQAERRKTEARKSHKGGDDASKQH